ncbi:MAG: dipeptidyl carboxypeptidase II [Acidobacteria bacterium]|nr:dipeptidyl carboxypeptidase II [Acidobacteriota bacterium]
MRLKSEPCSVALPLLAFGLTLVIVGLGGLRLKAQEMTGDNPFFARSPLPYQLPPFDRIDESHYLPAFERGMAEHLVEIDNIASSSDAPTFTNTLVALERSGRLLDRVASTFFSLSSADTTDALDEILGEVAPKLSAHSDRILLNADLFSRVRMLYDQRGNLDSEGESRRLVEKTYTDFVRAGALLSEEDKSRMQEINAELASLQTTFTQNVLDEVNASAVVVDTSEELAGLSDNQIASAAAAAADRGFEGKYVIPLLNTSGQPALASLDNRELREEIARVSLRRGIQGGEFDNREVITRIARLRAERSEMLGYPNHAAFSLEEQTAQTVEAVNERLASLVPPAVANARREAADLQAIAEASGVELTVSSWDWSYYTEKVRADRYAFDAAQLRPYFEIDAVIERGVFFAANRLYGLNFKERTDLPVYHPDVRVWEVFESDGSALGLFLGDYYARPSKRGGAWMNAYVSQSHLLGTSPVVANHLNIPKPPDGEPTLLTFDEVETMFHEFGHALHGFFSNVNYPYFAGTSVPRDFVEYPSQVNEMWATWPEVLKNYALHYETSEPMPAELLEKVMATQTFNQGFATTEYLAASLLDQAWHQLTVDEIPRPADVEQFEATALEMAGVALEAVPPRYRSTYFSHIWSSGYSAGYYSYIWSEVLDADSVEWFKQNGGLTRANGEHFRQTLLSKGGSVEALDLYRAFRGADPDVRPLLVRRGLN